MSDNISKELKTALLQDELTRYAAIEVFHRRGIVLLWGEAETDQVAKAAELIASRKPGVSKVINDIAVNELESEEFFYPGKVYKSQSGRPI
jgi:osmotically-inducible protein OsmY